MCASPLRHCRRTASLDDGTLHWQERVALPMQRADGSLPARETHTAKVTRQKDTKTRALVTLIPEQMQLVIAHVRTDMARSMVFGALIRFARFDDKEKVVEYALFIVHNVFAPSMLGFLDRRFLIAEEAMLAVGKALMSHVQTLRDRCVLSPAPACAMCPSHLPFDVHLPRPVTYTPSFASHR
eukprot:7031136-Prymnesium_polylepis.1